jgi:hypothetical protein
MYIRNYATNQMIYLVKHRRGKKDAKIPCEHCVFVAVNIFITLIKKKIDTDFHR